MAEYFYYLLALHHFLNITIYPAQVPLLLTEIFAGFAAYLFRGDHHDPDHHQCQEGHGDIQHDHAGKCDHDRHR